MKSKKLYFIRHGENEDLPEKASDELGLSKKGIEESRKIGKQLKVNLENTIGYCINNPRAKLSTVLAIVPNLKKTDFDIVTKKLVKDKKIKLNSSLTYSSSEDKEFKNKLIQSSKSNEVFKFIVNESDGFRIKSNLALTTYSTAASDISKILLKNCSLKFNEKNIKYKIFCSREFIFPCFRAKITDLLKGREERDNYIDLYESKFEGQDKGRLNFYEIEIIFRDEKVINIILRDFFDELEFNPHHLKYLIEEMKKNIQYVQKRRISIHTQSTQ